VKDSLVLHLNTEASKCIALNGAYRSKVQYDLRSYINFSADETIEYVTLSMPYAVITNSNYIVNEYNNVLNFTYAGSTSTTVIPEGNYTIASFITQIQSTAIPTNYFVMTYSNTTNKITLTSTPTYQSLFPGSTWGFAANCTCDYIFGFSGITQTTGTAITLPRSMNFLPCPRFIIHCNLLNNGLMLSNNSYVGSTDILASIPNVAKLNSQIIYENYSGEFLVKSLEATSIVISITDDNNNLINFNGISAYFVLRFNVFRHSIEKPLSFRKLTSYINQTAKNIPQSDEYIILDE
jgi:hypothetical protein